MKNLSIRNKRNRPPCTLGGVYFVTDGEAIKIGHANNINRRIAELQTSQHFPLYFIGGLSGGEHEERLLHRRFALLRIRGEWFEIHPDIFNFIDEISDERWIEGEQIENYMAKFGDEHNEFGRG